MKKLCSEIDAPFVIFLAALFFYNEAQSLPPPRFEPMGPAFFPEWVLTGIMVFSLYNIFMPVLRYFRQGRTEEGTKKEKGPSCQGALLFGTIALFAVFILAVVYTDIHFLLLSFVFMCVLGFLLAGSIKEHFLAIVLTAAGVSAAIYLLFGVLLEVFFP